MLKISYDYDDFEDFNKAPAKKQDSALLDVNNSSFPAHIGDLF